MKIVFVHGTGVREPTFYETYALIARRLRAHKCLIELVPCGWGEQCGVRLSLGGACIPDPPQLRALGPSDADFDAAYWHVLAEDPWFALRVAAVSQSAGQATPSFNRKPEGAALLGRLETWIPSEELTQILEDFSMSSTLEVSRKSLLENPVIRESRLLTMTQQELAPLLAHAMVALMTTESARMSVTSLTATQRGKLVDCLVNDLAGHVRGLGGMAIQIIMGIATKLGAMHAIENRRRAILDATAPVSGDILFYQVRGEKIRQFIKDTILSSDGQVILLAHSLGGIACVDLLATEQIKSVDLLITVGSQAAYFQEIGALWSVPLGEELPAFFPRWINIYDPWDMLSFCANKVFPGKVTDIAVRSGVNFPASHSAYWNNDDVWVAIAKEINL